MFRSTLIGGAVLTVAALFVTAPASEAQAQIVNGRGYYTYPYDYPYTVVPRRTFDDYVAERLRQRQIQQYYGRPYYPYYDDTYYGRQRLRTDVYRPYYEGRQFRYYGPYRGQRYYYDYY